MKNFNEKYIIRDFIDKNKWSNVYECINKDTNEKVILNILINLDKNEENLDAFKEEIDILKSMDNSNLIGVKDMYSYVNKDKTSYYLESECFKGLTLRELRESKVLNERQSLEIIREVIKGIKEFNDREINYRDLTEENIIINEKGIVKIDVLSFINKYEGYLNCQKILDEDFDDYEDVYVIGKILCRLITGKRSFNLDDYDEDIDVDLMGILMKSTNKRQRYKHKYNDLNEFLYEVNSYIEYGEIRKKKIVNFHKMNYSQNNSNMKKYIISAICILLVSTVIVFGGKKILNTLNKEQDIAQTVTPSEENKHEDNSIDKDKNETNTTDNNEKKTSTNNKVVSSEKIVNKKKSTTKENITKKEDKTSTTKSTENNSTKKESTNKKQNTNKNQQTNNKKEDKNNNNNKVDKPTKKPVKKPTEEEPSQEEPQDPENGVEDKPIIENPSGEDPSQQDPGNGIEDKPIVENSSSEELVSE